MINEHKVLAIIPARGGSKGILKKNIKVLNGKPLIQYTIDIAKEVPDISKIIISTDDNDIIDLSISLGVDVIKRPAELSTDSSLVKDAIQYTVKKLEEEGNVIKYILLLEPTSPLRKVEDIQKVIDKLKHNENDSVATFSKSCISPGRLWKIDNNKLSTFFKGSNPWLPRQQQPDAYELNGLVYGFTRKSLIKYKNEDSILVGNIDYVIVDRQVIDIDTMMDFLIVEKIMEKQNEKA